MNEPDFTASEILRGSPLSAADAARLITEALELLRPQCLDRLDLIQLLRSTLHAGVEAIQKKSQTVPFAEAAWASVEARKGRRAATLADLRHFVRRMLRVPGVAERPLRAMTTAECRLLLERAFSNSLHSYRKGRAILHSIFTYGFRREWCDGNPVDRIETPGVREKEIVPLTPEEIDRLLETARRPEFSVLRLPLHLMLYCGVRPAEVRRIDPLRDINWCEKTVTIRATSSKTGGGRVIPLRHTHGAGLSRTQSRMAFPERLWRAFRRRAGFRHWVPDVLRHTFASYHAARFRNFAELQMEMGHRDASLLRTRYVNTAGISAGTAAAFWRQQGTGLTRHP